MGIQEASKILRPRWTAVLVLVSTLAVVGCGAEDEARQIPAGPAVILASDGARGDWLTPAAGAFAEVLVPAVAIDRGDHLRVRPLSVPSLQRGQNVSLVVEGALADVELEEVDIQSLAEGLRSAVLDHQNRGSLVNSVLVGYSIAGEECVACPGLRELRSRIGLNVLLGVITDFDSAVGSASQTLRTSIDYLVVPVYGQPQHDLDDPAYWELEQTQERLRALDELGTPFRSLLHLEGRAHSLSDESVALDELDPQVLIAEAVRAQSEFQFEGFYRQVFAIELSKPLRNGDRLFQTGVRLVVSRPTPQHVRALAQRIRSLELANHLGVVFARPVTPDNALGVAESSLLSILGPGAPGEEIEDAGLVARVERVAGSSRQWTLRLNLRNDGDPTAVAQRRFNYLELVVPGAAIGTVDMGDFVRMELDNTQEDLAGMARVRRADRLRLYYPFLPTGIEIGTGDVVVSSTEPLVEASVVARFIGPVGDDMESKTVYWPPREEELEEEADTEGQVE